MRLLLASRNANKLCELRRAVPAWEIELLRAPDEPVEDGETFRDNARIKARHGRAHAAADAWVAGEDSSAETDMNVVMTGEGELVEVQATAERDPFSRELLDRLLDLAAGGIERLTAAQREVVATPRPAAGS